MTIRPLVIAPDERLLIASATVEVVDDSIRTLLDDMLETMYANDGIGLAAVQIGVHKRCIVIDVAVREGANAPMKFVNAEIITKADNESVFNEGCLSFPDQYSEVVRPETVTVRYLDENGVQKTIEADGILATCLQHEIDHTNGIVFVDHISNMKRDIILRKLKKAKRMGLISEMPEPSKV
ncbi:MAG: peptide deformylase [Rickettsiales bacterium]|nr:peptide deformylase [Rickettsiales bacterium]